MWEEKMRRAAEENGWTFIGITGITNSGKSTVAKRIAKRVPAETVNQDVYFRVGLINKTLRSLVNALSMFAGP